MLNLPYNRHLLILHALYIKSFKIITKYLNNKSRDFSLEKRQFYHQTWLKAAQQLGGSVEPITSEIMEIDLDGKKYFVEGNYTPVDNCSSLRIAGSKTAVYRLMGRAGLPIADYLEFDIDTILDAKRFLADKQLCVVKPTRNTSGGDGVTTGITNESQLRRAVVEAYHFSSSLIIEEQVDGNNYRLLYLNGALLDCIRRDPPSIIGDGRSTIAKLIKKENADRFKHGIEIAHSPIYVNLDMHITLSKQKLGLGSVIEKGASVKLKNVVNENRFSDNKVVTDHVCPSVIEAGLRAVEATGVKLAGVDIQTPDISNPLESVDGRILEVNTTPGFYYHYNRDSDVCDVALHVLRDLKRLGK